MLGAKYPRRNVVLETKTMRYSWEKKPRSVGELAQKIKAPNPSEISPSQTLFINLIAPFVVGVDGYLTASPFSHVFDFDGPMLVNCRPAFPSLSIWDTASNVTTSMAVTIKLIVKVYRRMGWRFSVFSRVALMGRSPFNRISVCTFHVFKSIARKSPKLVVTPWVMGDQCQ